MILHVGNSNVMSGRSSRARGTSRRRLFRAPPSATHLSKSSRIAVKVLRPRSAVEAPIHGADRGSARTASRKLDAAPFDSNALLAQLNSYSPADKFSGHSHPSVQLRRFHKALQHHRKANEERNVIKAFSCLNLHMSPSLQRPLAQNLQAATPR